MAVLATPQNHAFVIDDKDAAVLNKRSSAVLDALRRIRKVETSTSSPDRLRQLDQEINKLENE